MAVCQSGQSIPDSIFCRRFIESVRLMACVICALRWEASYCIACVTASAFMVRLEVVTLWDPLHSPSTLLDREPPTRQVPCPQSFCQIVQQTTSETCTVSGRKCRTAEPMLVDFGFKSALKCGVPQGSVLGPLLFTLYTQSLSTVICQSSHSYHFFADDSQLHNLSTPSDFPVLVHSLKDCIEDVAAWMCDSMLKMNHDKTELIAIGTKPKISQVTLSITPVSISGRNIPFSQSVRNLGVFIDETLSMDVHIKHLCSILFCQLRRLGKIRPFLSTDAANKLAVSFVLTRLDYCNSLFAGLPDNKLNKPAHTKSCCPNSPP